MGFTLVDKDTPDDDALKNAPAFKPTEPFAEIRGEPGVWYTQGAWFFDRARQPVRPAPRERQYVPPEVDKLSRRERAEMARKEAVRIIGKQSTPTVPKTVADAERENARARAAEQQAG